MRRRLLYILERTATRIIYEFTDDESRHVSQITDLPEELRDKVEKGDFLFMIYTT